MVELGLRKSFLEEFRQHPENFKVPLSSPAHDMIDPFVEYRKGGEGFAKWCEDKVFVPIYPEDSDIPEYYPMSNLPSTPNPKTGKSYWTMWEEQKEICREALRMEDNRFVYNQIVFCWMRGEGKSLLACLIQLWKFFNWPRQQIMLGANSKDQIKFVHYDIMREIIQNSPKLLAEVGRKNIQEKEIRIKDEFGAIRSIIRSISSFSGIVSNITGYTFSEIFDMKNPKFYVQLDGSIRNIPNALGVIDSTVSAKTHILYKLYMSALKKKTRKVFFSYRYSPDANPDNYWNPNMDADQLNDYQEKFPFGEFERYFLNLWSAGIQQVFTPEMIEEIYMLGADGGLLNHNILRRIMSEKERLLQLASDTKGKGFADGSIEALEGVDKLMDRCTPVSSVYRLKNMYGNSEMATVEHLERLGNMFDTDWLIMAGADFGDPYAIRGYAKTIFTLCAKGLPRSRSDPNAAISSQVAPKYLYIQLHVANILDHSLDVVKQLLETASEEFGGVDTFCSERFGAWDVASWCEERDIEFEPIFPTYDRQREAFKEVLLVVREGRFKSPPLGIAGVKKEDIMKEEMGMFNHDSDIRWFGSPEKMEKYGIQDDYMFSLGWCWYGGRLKGVDDFRPRHSLINFGSIYQNETLLGKYA